MAAFHFAKTSCNLNRPSGFGIFVHTVIKTLDQRRGKGCTLLIRQPHRVVQQVL